MKDRIQSNPKNNGKLVESIDFKAITSVLVNDPLLPDIYFSINDLDGNVLAASSRQNILEKYHRNYEASAKSGHESAAILATQIKSGERFALHTDFNNLTDAAIPLNLEGELVGHLIIGQVFLEPPDLDFFAHQARKLGFDESAYLSAIKSVPVLPEQKLREIIQFYSGLTSMMGSLALQAYNYRELSDTLAQRTRQLEYVNSELEAFTYSASHDLRAPLRHITGYIELFKKKCGSRLDKQGMHYFEAICDSAKHMSLLIDELLQFSRNGHIDMFESEVDMNEIVNHCLERFDGAKELVEKTDSFPLTHCDPGMLKIVWFNLIDNAVKFTAKVSNPSIKIGSCKDNEGSIVYFIKDNGVGFDMKYADKLFGVFQRLHPREDFEGTGIGLATVKRIISRHGGRIWAHAEPGGGAAFYFTIPGEGEVYE